MKIYIELKGLQEKCTNDDDIHLDYTETSFQLTIQNYDDDDNKERCLCFSKLYDDIEKASLKKKKDRVIISLVKKKKGADGEISDEGDGDDHNDGVKDWPCIGAVGAPKE